MYKRRRINVLIIGVIVLSLTIIISLVYAGFTGQLNINGTSVNRKSKWDIHFENLSSITTTGSAKVLSNPSLDGTTTIEDYSVSMTSPGDTISFTFKVVNDGNYDASISSINIGTPTCTGIDATSNTNVCNKLTYTLTDENGSAIQVGDTVYAKDSQTMKVTLLYQEFSDASLLPTEDVSISNLDITINYQQSGSALVKDNGEVANYKVYKVGDKVTVNNEDYWVIANSGIDQDYVVALKDLPLTVAEVNTYGTGHVNRYARTSIGTAYNSKGYGGMAYYTSETCGYVNGSNITTGCTKNYSQSEVKYAVDAWAQAKFTNDELKEVNGYSVRLITRDEYNAIPGTNNWKAEYIYPTMTPHPTLSNHIYYVFSLTLVGDSPVDNYTSVVRPVINVYKSALDDSLD